MFINLKKCHFKASADAKCISVVSIGGGTMLSLNAWDCKKNKIKTMASYLQYEIIHVCLYIQIDLQT